MKTCSICKKEKSASDFHKHLSTRDRLRKECKICRNLQSKTAYQKRPKNKTKIDGRSLKPKQSREQILNKQNVYAKNRYNNDLSYRLTRVLRVRLRTALKNQYKKTSAVKSLGCSLNELKTYLESKFQTGMSWSNYGKKGWHIDHIVPISLFDLTDTKQVEKACHYSNLQPLWAVDNFKKGNRL